jgi:potassium-transporting ATPase KdpC subunit
MIFKHIQTSVTLLLVLTVLTGLVYPLVITGIAQLIFPLQANGSLVVRDGQVIGSALIGQQFKDPGHFWGRPSATTPMPYNASASSGSNLGPLNPALLEAVRERIRDLRNIDSLNTLPIPVDLVTASGSGLDPHISVAAARFQIGRVALVRGVSPVLVNALVQRHIEGRQFGVLGEPRVNVLLLNLDLDRIPGNTVKE